MVAPPQRVLHGHLSGNHGIASSSQASLLGRGEFQDDRRTTAVAFHDGYGVCPMPSSYVAPLPGAVWRGMVVVVVVGLAVVVIGAVEFDIEVGRPREEGGTGVVVVCVFWLAD